MKSLLPTLLLVLFVGLKLANVIDWSWWWVTAPFWVPLALALIGYALLWLAHRNETPQQKAARMLREYADALRKGQ